MSKLVPVGGGLYRNVDPYLPFMNLPSTLSEIFRFPGSNTLLREFVDDASLGDRILTQTIGTLEFAVELGGEENLPTKENSPEMLIALISAIKRALRPAFKVPPKSELEVQDRLEVIVRAQGIKFDRESQIAHATKKVKPDFTLPDLHTAIEVKLCNSVRREKEIIEEIGADIVAYRKQYPAIVFVVYDVATISDKEAFIQGFNHETGVLIEIVS